MQNCSHIFDVMNMLKTHMTVMHDTLPSVPPKIGQIVRILKITGDRRHKAGGRRQEAGGRRQEAEDEKLNLNMSIKGCIYTHKKG